MLDHKSLFVTVLSFSHCGMHEVSIIYIYVVCVLCSYKRMKTCVLERGGNGCKNIFTGDVLSGIGRRLI